MAKRKFDPATIESLDLEIDYEDFTFGELEDFEEMVGKSFNDAFKMRTVRDEDGHPVPDPDDEKGRPLQEPMMDARTMTSLVLITLRREFPDITHEDVRKLKLKVMQSKGPKEEEAPVSKDDSSENDA